MMHVPHLLKLLGWNQRPLNYFDFETACDQQEVIVQRAPIKTLGMYFLCEGQPFITLSNNLHGVRLWMVAWHEMVHHLLHPPGLRCFSRGTVRKTEGEANVLAVCSVLDQQTLMRIAQQGELHDYPKDLVDFRIRVAGRFQI
jgi:Zn-dependent peptidase ImmA (M78 family)